MHEKNVIPVCMFMGDEKPCYTSNQAPCKHNRQKFNTYSHDMNHLVTVDNIHYTTSKVEAYNISTINPRVMVGCGVWGGRFFRKSGRVTHVVLSISDGVQSLRKIVRAVFSKSTEPASNYFLTYITSTNVENS